MIIAENNHTYNYDFGVMIKNALKSRGITQKQFAETFGIKESNLSGMINGKRRIPNDLLPIISELIMVNEDVLRNYQDRNKSLTKSVSLTPEEENAQKRIDEFNAIVSVKSLLKGICDNKAMAICKLEALKHHYCLVSPSDLNDQMLQLSENCFRRSERTGLDKTAIATWVVKARAAARKEKIVYPFIRERMDELITVLHNILHHNSTNEDTEEMVKDILNKYGIGYCYVQKEPKASIDGYSFIIDGTPFVVVTKRFNRIDNYAFSLMHEIGHIYLGHVNSECGLINIVPTNYDEMDGILPQDLEKEADNFATEKLISNRLWFLAPTVSLNPTAIQTTYMRWAQSKGLDPWIVLGRVSHETGMYRFTSDESRLISSKVRKEDGMNK